MLNLNRNYVIASMAFSIGIIALILPSRFKNVIVSTDFDIGDLLILGLSTILFLYARRSYSRKGIILAIFAVCILIVSNVFSTEGQLSAIFKYISFFIVLALIPIRFVLNRTHIKSIIWCITLYSVITIFSSLFHSQFQLIFGWSDTAYGLASGSLRRARGLTGGPIVTAEILVICLVLLASIKKEIPNVILILVSLIVYIGILLTFSRIALVLATIIFVFIVFKSALGGLVKFSTFLITTILCILGLVMISPTVLSQSDLINRYNLLNFSFDTSVDNQDVERIDTLQNTSSLIASRPWIGFGPKSLFIYKNLQSNQDTQNTVVFEGRLYLLEPHSVFLLWAQEIGVIGMIAILLYIVNLSRFITKYSIFCLVVVLALSLTSSDLFISIQVEAVMVVAIILINSLRREANV